MEILAFILLSVVTVVVGVPLAAILLAIIYEITH